MCCDHNVGIKYFKELKDCKKKCGDLLLGINWKLLETKKTSKVVKKSSKRVISN
jgi:hypothetical protein